MRQNINYFGRHNTMTSRDRVTVDLEEHMMESEEDYRNSAEYKQEWAEFMADSERDRLISEKLNGEQS
tara:strand:- start:397 stop:600 length:204 start_codon:yes stop_codon:yes gene_type:complete